MTAPQALKFWPRAISWPIRVLLFAFTWGLGVAFLLTGLVLWRDWHALAERGVAAAGQVEHCKWEPSGGIKIRISGSGYFSCTYTYRAAPAGVVHDGYFQSSRRWADGQPIPIRYLPDRPDASAAAEDLEYPSIIAGAMIALGVGWLGWFARQAWKERTARKG